MRLRLAVLALLLCACYVRIQHDYEGEPQYSHQEPESMSVPKAVAIPRSGKGSSAALGWTRRGAERNYRISVANASPEPGAWIYVNEFFDHRGKLIRRHTVGPLILAAGTEQTFHATMRLPSDEARAVDRTTARLQELP